MQAVDAQLNNGALTDLHHLIFQLFTGLIYYLFNTGRVNTAILYKTLQR
jgi:hypothetical protein